MNDIITVVIMAAGMIVICTFAAILADALLTGGMVWKYVWRKAEEYLE